MKPKVALAELEPQFLRAIDGMRWAHVGSLDKAHGIVFLCAKCFRENGGRVGTHAIICWSRSRGAPEDLRPLPGRWKMSGTSLADLTLSEEDDAPAHAKGKSSIQLSAGCMWHGYVTNGEVKDA